MAAQKINHFSSFRSWVAPGAILLLAFFLRVWGIGFGLPHLYHADEPIVVNHALNFANGDFNPHFFNIPPLTSYLLFWVYGILFIVGKIAGAWSDSAQFAHLFFRDPTLFYVVGRLFLGVLPSILSIYVLMSWVRQQGRSDFFVHLAGFLFAVCFVHVSDAHYIYADIPLVFAMIVFFYQLHMVDFSLIRNHIWLGALIGIAAAFKYNGIFLALPYLWMLFRSLCGLSYPKRCLAAITAGVACIILFCLLNPFAILDHSFFIQELREQSAANQGVPFFHHIQ